MVIAPVDRGIPSDLLWEYNRLKYTGLAALMDKDFKKARTIFARLYELLDDHQERYGRPIHKGMPLYHLGVALLNLGEPDDAVRTFLLAYVEDTLNVNHTFEDDADRERAARMLKHILIFDRKVMTEIKNQAAAVKKEGRWSAVTDPQTILDAALSTMNLDAADLINHCRCVPPPGKSLLGFPEPKDQRVFVGTDYRKNPSMVTTAKAAIRSRELVPVVAIDYGLGDETLHDDILLLLHTCGHAVIDISSLSGQVIEIERARDYNVNVLLVMQAIDCVNHPPKTSAMIQSLSQSCGYPLRCYESHAELYRIIQQFLPC
jgi:hypothetical protein